MEEKIFNRGIREKPRNLKGKGWDEDTLDSRRPAQGNSRLNANGDD